jgi:hypothetical protein
MSVRFWGFCLDAETEEDRIGDHDRCVSVVFWETDR